MLKPIGFLAAIQLLNFFGVFTDIFNWFKFFISQTCGAMYAAVTSLDSNWLFMQGTGMPVQMRYTHSAIRDRAEWQYIERTGQWVRRGCLFGERAHKFPFVLITLNVGGSRYEMTEFFANHTYYHPQGRPSIPEPLMLVNAWSIMSHIWFNFEQLQRGFLEIMNMNCDIISVPIIMPREHLGVYYEQFGLTLGDNDESESESGESESGEESGESEGSDEGSESESGDKESGDKEGESESEGSEEGEEKGSEEETGSDTSTDNKNDDDNDATPAATSADTETPPLEKVD